MGWTWFNKSSDISAAEWFKDLYNLEGNGERYEVLDVAIVRLRTLYAAVKIKETGEVWAAVYLLGYAPNDYYNFGYKDMDETMGPNESECPERILKLLTPTDSKWANEWRERCWQNIKRRKSKPKVQDRSRIKFTEPLRFTDGAVLDEFTVHMVGKKVRFISGGGLYRITNWREREFQIVR